MISASRSYQRPLLYRWVYFLPILIFLTPLVQIARADGGIVICQQSSAPFTITVFATEMPLRPGIADLSVLVEPTEGHSAILDAQVLIELEHETGVSIHAEATRSQAHNKLLYCSLIDLPSSGHWKMRVKVRRGDSRAEAFSDLTVAAPQAVLVSYWELIALPPSIIILFIMNQALRGRRSIRRSIGAARP